METTLVLKDVNLCWSYLNFAKYAKYKNLGHTFLNCSVNGKVSSDGSACKILLDDNKSRLASIYARCSALISHPVSFNDAFWANIVGGSSFSSLFVCSGSTASGASLKIKPTPMVSMKLNDRFVALKCSLASLVECIDKLAKRLNSPEPIVSQSSPECQLLMTLSSQN
ncbi:hypothetical protein G9A89_020830 [Geosiphon pyriformis]|nr:hypothetical protein G9A89_020830 [Geosiphon pyriformis]